MALDLSNSKLEAPQFFPQLISVQLQSSVPEPYLSGWVQPECPATR
jgi:hypothetical protein